MSSISQYEYNIRRYETLKKNVNSVMSKLSLAIDNTNDIAIEMKSKYQINDISTPIASRTTKLKSNIESVYNYLNSKVVPELDSVINSLNKEVEHLEKEECQHEEHKKIKKSG